MAWASGGKVSPAQRQICGDREHLGRQIPWLDAFCHLTVSPYSKLTFLFYCLSSNSSPMLCCHKLCTGKHGALNVIMGKESLFPSTNRTCSSTLYTVCLWIVLLLQSSKLLLVEGVMQPCIQGRMMSLVSSPRPTRCFLWSHGASTDLQYHGREDWRDTNSLRHPAARPHSLILSPQGQSWNTCSPPRSILCQNKGVLSAIRGVASLSVPASRITITACQCPRKKKNTHYAYYSNTSRQCLELLGMIA